MPRVTFISDFDWYPPELKGRWMTAYKTGWFGLVTTPCAAAAKANGKIAEPRQGAAETGGDPAGSTERGEASASTKRG